MLFTQTGAGHLPQAAEMDEACLQASRAVLSMWCVEAVVLLRQRGEAAITEAKLAAKLSITPDQASGVIRELRCSGLVETRSFEPGYVGVRGGISDRIVKLYHEQPEALARAVVLSGPRSWAPTGKARLSSIDVEDPATPPVALIQLPRTASKSLGAAIVQRYGSKAFKVKQWTLNAEMARAIPANARIVFGHMSYGLHHHLPVRYATLLREPVSRTISHYRFHRQKYILQGNAPPTLDEFTRKKVSRNLQTRILSGVYENGQKAPLHETLALAKENLLNFTAVGFFERLGDFCSRFDLGSSLDRFPEPVEQLNLDRSLISRLLAANLADADLYQWARERWPASASEGRDRPEVAPALNRASAARRAG